MKIVRVLALTALIVGAISSLGFMFYTGRHNDSIILLLLFTGWDISPFIALLLANAIANRLSLGHKTLNILMILIAIGSPIIYSGVLSPPETKPAFVFLVVPLISWLLIVSAITVSRLMEKGKKE